MHDSFTPLGGMVPLVNIMLGEVIFGGVGAGMYGMLIYIVLAVFIAGLMVGRTPEYLGKKIEAYDVKMAMLVGAGLPARILVFTAISRVCADFRTVQITQSPVRMASPKFFTPSPRRRKQRFGVRRNHGEHALVQHDHRHRDAGRAVPDDHPDAGHRGKPGAKRNTFRLRSELSR